MPFPAAEQLLVGVLVTAIALFSVMLLFAFEDWIRRRRRK